MGAPGTLQQVRVAPGAGMDRQAPLFQSHDLFAERKAATERSGVPVDRGTARDLDRDARLAHLTPMRDRAVLLTSRIGARVETACLTPSQGADADADSSSTGSTKWTPPPGWEGPTRSSSTSGSRNGPSQGNGFWCRGTWARSWKTQRPASLAARLQGAPQRHAAPPRCDRRRGLTLAPMDWPVPTTRQRGFVSRPRQQPDPGP